jgi:hypothetical protein
MRPPDKDARVTGRSMAVRRMGRPAVCHVCRWSPGIEGAHYVWRGERPACSSSCGVACGLSTWREHLYRVSTPQALCYCCLGVLAMQLFSNGGVESWAAVIFSPLGRGVSFSIECIARLSGNRGARIEKEKDARDRVGRRIAAVVKGRAISSGSWRAWDRRVAKRRAISSGSSVAWD